MEIRRFIYYNILRFSLNFKLGRQSPKLIIILVLVLPQSSNIPEVVNLISWHVADDAAFAAFDLDPLRQMEITTRQSIRLLSVCSGHPSLQEAKALTPNHNLSFGTSSVFKHSRGSESHLMALDRMMLLLLLLIWIHSVKWKLQLANLFVC
jgi:hypothetical protein